jgi:sulfonate transport system permease protein
MTPIGGELRDKGLSLLVVFAVWEGYVRWQKTDPLLLPPPSAILARFWDGLASGELVAFTWRTLQWLMVSMAIGIALALAVSAFAITTRLGRISLSTATSVLNPLPGIAVLPLAILWFGINTKALLFTVVNSIIWAMALNTQVGFETVPITLRLVGQNLGLSAARLVSDVLLPAALPNLLTGMRISWAYGWRTVIAAELVFGSTAGSSGGLGWMIYMARYNLDTAGVFAGLLSLVAIGFIVESLFQQVEAVTVRRWGMVV